MKSVLQRHVLEKVLKYADDYFKIKENDDLNDLYNQEKSIVNHTNKLLELLTNFYNNDDDDDNNNNNMKQGNDDHDDDDSGGRS